MKLMARILEPQGAQYAKHIENWPRVLTVETAMEWIDRDELVEVTPLNVRVRKVILNASFRPARRETAE